MIVVYEVAAEDYMEVFNDAAARRDHGWRMLSVDSLAVRTQGAAFAMFTGNSHALDVRYTVLYEKVEPA